MEGFVLKARISWVMQRRAFICAGALVLSSALAGNAGAGAIVLGVAPSNVDSESSVDIAALFETVRPAVVKVYAKRLVVVEADEIRSQFVTAQGSGVLIGSDGPVLTVAHLVQASDEIWVEFADGSKSPARVHASEPAADVATLRLERVSAAARFAKLADSDRMPIGERLVLVGFPYDFPATISVGRLNGRVVFASDYAPLDGLETLVTDATVVEGTSGAPLFDLHSRVVGIASAAARTTAEQGALSGVGLAISARVADKLLLARRSLWTGIGGRWISGKVAYALHLAQASGLLVQGVAAHSPASALRLRAGTAAAAVNGRKFVLGGDVILSMQGYVLAEPGGYERASKAMAEMATRGSLQLTVQRGPQVIDVVGEIER